MGALVAQLSPLSATFNQNKSFCCALSLLPYGGSCNLLFHGFQLFHFLIVSAISVSSLERNTKSNVLVSNQQQHLGIKKEEEEEKWGGMPIGDVGLERSSHVTPGSSGGRGGGSGGAGRGQPPAGAPTGPRNMLSGGRGGGGFGRGGFGGFGGRGGRGGFGGFGGRGGWSGGVAGPSRGRPSVGISGGLREEGHQGGHWTGQVAMSGGLSASQQRDVEINRLESEVAAAENRADEFVRAWKEEKLASRHERVSDDQFSLELASGELDKRRVALRKEEPALGRAKDRLKTLRLEKEEERVERERKQEWENAERERQEERDRHGEAFRAETAKAVAAKRAELEERQEDREKEREMRMHERMYFLKLRKWKKGEWTSKEKGEAWVRGQVLKEVQKEHLGQLGELLRWSFSAEGRQMAEQCGLEDLVRNVESDERWKLKGKEWTPPRPVMPTEVREFRKKRGLEGEEEDPEVMGQEEA